MANGMDKELNIGIMDISYMKVPIKIIIRMDKELNIMRMEIRST